MKRNIIVIGNLQFLSFRKLSYFILAISVITQLKLTAQRKPFVICFLTDHLRSAAFNLAGNDQFKTLNIEASHLQMFQNAIFSLLIVGFEKA